jgi:hypothetical protein
VGESTGVDVELERRGFGPIYALAVDSFEERVVRRSASVVAFLISSPLRLELAPFRRREGRS